MRAVQVMAVAVMLLTCGRAGAVDFEKEIKPIFLQSCAGCHGEEKGLGNLRLHTPEAIAESLTKHSDLIVKDKIDESQLYARLVLPADSPKRMPKGADPLPAEQIALIKKWIEEGGATTAAAAPAPAADMPAAEAAPAEKPAPPKVEQPASPEAIAAVEKLGALVLPLYAKSAELRISFPSSADQVTDETVAALVPLAAQTVELDLGGSKVTDAAAESLAQFKRLERLHLEKTAVGDATVGAVAALPYLSYLNVHSTKVTDAGVSQLGSAPSLERLYLWQAPVSYEAAKALEQAKAGLVVNLGWDHPGVVRERLTAELAQVEARKAEADKSAAEAQKSLEAAQASQKAADERLAEIKKQLEALDKPAEEAAPAAEQQPEEKPAEDKA